MSARRSLLRPLAVGAVAVAASIGLVACSGSSDSDDKTIQVGTSPGPYSVLFQDGIDPVLTDAGYTVEYTEFTDLQQADVALSEGSVDLNVDQHTSYMDNFNKETNSDLAALTPIPTVPAGIYSEKYDSIDAVADGQSVGIPADASNQARAFLMLRDAGWITLKEDANPGLLTGADVEENPHNLNIQPMDSATIPRSLPDLDWGVIPGSISYSAGTSPELQYFQENLRPELILQAVTREDQVDADWAQAVIDAYRSPEFHEFLAEENDNDYWFVPEDILPAASE